MPNWLCRLWDVIRPILAGETPEIVIGIVVVIFGLIASVRAWANTTVYYFPRPTRSPCKPVDHRGDPLFFGLRWAALPLDCDILPERTFLL